MIRDDITIIVNVYQLLDKESVKEFFFYILKRQLLQIFMKIMIFKLDQNILDK